MPFAHRLRASAALIAALAALPAGAAPKSDAPVAPVVDLNRLLEEYKKTESYARYQARYREKERQVAEELRTLAQVRYCSEAERKEGLAIRARPSPSDAEKARWDELVRKTEAIDKELAVLAQKQDPTEADTKRLGEITQLRTDAQRMLVKEEVDRREQLRRVYDDLFTEVEQELLKVIEKVAREQKVPVVFNRRQVLYGGTDLTDLVIKKLGK